MSHRSTDDASAWGRWVLRYRWVWILGSALSLTGSGADLAGWMGMELTPASVAAPTILLTLAVADCVHIAVGVLHRVRDDAAQQDAIVDSLRDNLWPIFLGSVPGSSPRASS